MGLHVKVTIEGGEELLRKLQKMGVDVREALREAALEGAEAIRGPANQSAPGPHIIAEVVGSDQKGVTVAIGPDEEHWYYRFFESGAQAHEITGTPLVFQGEEGTVVTGRVGHPGMAARPFLRPAFDRHKDDAEAGVGEKLRKIIEPS
jgi:HK97 gp10 family phage protein